MSSALGPLAHRSTPTPHARPDTFDTARRPRPPRVLQLLACDGWGGTETQLSVILERMNRDVVAPSIATLAPRGPVVELAEAGGIPAWSLGGGGSAAAGWRLARLLRRTAPDVVAAYGIKASLIARAAVRLAERPPKMVVGVQAFALTETEDASSLKARVALALERSATGSVDIYDSNSPGAAEMLVRAGIDRRRVRYIPSGIDVSQWPAPSPRVEGSPVVICAVARLIPRKRIGDLIEAFSALAAEKIEARLVIAGGGPLLPTLTRQTASLGLESRVEFTGSIGRDGVKKVFARSNVFCLPSTFEGMPGALMEAMASGLPVVGTRVSGISEFVVNGETGFLVPPRDPLELARALRSAVMDSERSDEMGREARRFMERDYSMDSIVRQKEALYVELANERAVNFTRRTQG